MEQRDVMVGVLNRARNGGAKAVEVLRIARETLEQQDSRGKATTTESLTWAVRVWREGGANGKGQADTPQAALSAAMAQAEQAAADPTAGPAERMAIRTTGMGIDDRRHFGISDADRSDVLHLAERATQSIASRIRNIHYRQVREVRTWLSSRGVEAEEATTTYLLSALAQAGEFEVAHRIGSRHFSDVASLPFGTELKRRVDPLLKPYGALRPDLPVVLDPRVVAELIRSLAPAFSAVAVRNGSSFVARYLGGRLASPMLHVTDDGGLFGGMYSCSFDDRGVPPIPVALLKEGMVHSLYHDPETARAEGLRPTGHVHNGQLRPSNLIIRPGSRTRNVVLAELGSYLLLDRPPFVELSAGRFQGEAPLVVVEKGEKKGFVKVFFDMPVERFLGAVAEMVSDHERSLEVDAPTTVFHPSILTPAR